MKRYKNLSRDSGVIAYEVGSDSISIQFEDGCVYLYTYQSAGQANIEHMKSLAVAGQGLSSFISQTAKKQFASKKC